MTFNAFLNIYCFYYQHKRFSLVIIFLTSHIRMAFIVFNNMPHPQYCFDFLPVPLLKEPEAVYLAKLAPFSLSSCSHRDRRVMGPLQTLV